eukprot:CAMPEP_0182421942 /NCGR_PEP_ID=MMETSP1167-20130531/7519_1 /TAXON_ID=2988 /ORGANISM="Mallomonas Sp, Strain CCMP3275" /LENGTH=961 /DNA_ID=CAMNT_0024599589 /DNA_START=77 /DNA_END=2962 /DNA_ORIENTATION=-
MNRKRNKVAPDVSSKFASEEAEEMPRSQLESLFVARSKEVESLSTTVRVQEDILSIQSFLAMCTAKQSDNNILAVQEYLQSSKDWMQRAQNNIDKKPHEEDLPTSGEAVYLEENFRRMEQSLFEKSMTLESDEQAVHSMVEKLRSQVDSTLRDKGSPTVPNFTNKTRTSDIINGLTEYILELLKWTIDRANPLTLQEMSISTVSNHEVSIGKSDLESLNAQYSNVCIEKEFLANRLHQMEEDLKYERQQSKLIIEKLVKAIYDQNSAFRRNAAASVKGQTIDPKDLDMGPQVQKVFDEKCRMLEEVEGGLSKLITRNRQTMKEIIKTLGKPSIQQKVPDLQRLLDNTSSGNSSAIFSFLNTYLSSVHVYVEGLSTSGVRATRSGGDGMERALQEKTKETSDLKNAVKDMIHRHKQAIKTSIKKLNRPVVNGVTDLEKLLEADNDCGLGFLNSYLLHLLPWVISTDSSINNNIKSPERQSRVSDEQLQELRKKIIELQEKVTASTNNDVQLFELRCRVKDLEEKLEKEILRSKTMLEEKEIEFDKEVQKLVDNKLEYDREHMKKNITDELKETKEAVKHQIEYIEKKYKKQLIDIESKLKLEMKQSEMMLSILVEAVHHDPLPDIEEEYISDESSWQHQLYYLKQFQMHHIQLNAKNLEYYLRELHVWIHNVIQHVSNNRGVTASYNRNRSKQVINMEISAPVRYEFFIVQTTDGELGLYKGIENDDKQWKYELETPSIRGKNTSRVYTLQCTNRSITANSTTFDRMEFADREFCSTSHSLCDWTDVVEAAKLMGAKDLAKALKFYDRDGPLISYNGKTEWDDGLFYFMSSFSTRVRDGFVCHDKLENGKICVASWHGEYPVLVKMYIDKPAGLLESNSGTELQEESTNRRMSRILEEDNEPDEFVVPDSVKRLSMSGKTTSRERLAVEETHELELEDNAEENRSDSGSEDKGGPSSGWHWD